VTVLAIGIGLLAAVSWAANGLLAARSSASQAAGPAVTQSVASAPAHTHAARASTRPSPSLRSSPAPSPQPSAAGAAAGRPARACAPGAVTLRLSTPQNWYQPGATPRFTVSAISERARPCRFNMGTKFVAVVIADGGRHIWSSADCVSGGGSNRVILTQGVPAVLHLSWDRRTSSPGCGGIRQLVPAGEYQVAAVSGPIRSATQNVVLGTKGISGP
jgi:hypothetical protein